MNCIKKEKTKPSQYHATRAALLLETYKRELAYKSLYQA